MTIPQASVCATNSPSPIKPPAKSGSPVRASEPSRTSAASNDEDPFASDLALALMMQEQERAHFLLSGGGFDSVGLDGSAGTSAPGSLEEGALATQDPGDSDTSDEALAWRLMQEEERAFNQRLIAMASAQFIAEPEAGEEREEAALEDPLAAVPEVDQMSYEGLLALGDMAGHVSRGATESALTKIRKVIVGDPSSCHGPPFDELMQEECSVCRMEYEKGDELSVLPCGHFYHTSCISQWLEVNKACPICHKEVLEDDRA